MRRCVRDNRISGMPSWVCRKLKGRGGFSLAETLLAVLILLLVSVIVATGMPAATNAYNKIILGANAKVMLSTAVTALHDEIGTAWQVVEQEPGNTTSLTYFNASTGAKSKLLLGKPEDTPKDKDTLWNNIKAICVQDYVSLEMIHSGSSEQGELHGLVPYTASDMYVTYKCIGYKDGIVTINGLKVCKTDGTELVTFNGADGKPKDFTIRVISHDSVESTGGSSGGSGGTGGTGLTTG